MNNHIQKLAGALALTLSMLVGVPASAATMNDIYRVADRLNEQASGHKRRLMRSRKKPISC